MNGFIYIIRNTIKASKLVNIPYSTFRKACVYNHIEYNSSTSAQHTK
nr:MAG TPA: hypothetical protein [Crassvirales sp.]